MGLRGVSLLRAPVGRFLEASGAVLGQLLLHLEALGVISQNPRGPRGNFSCSLGSQGISNNLGPWGERYG